MSSSTPEGKVKKIIKDVLKDMGAYYHMPVQNGMGKPSLDFICCVRGKFVAIEAKAKGGHTTLRQKLTLKEMEKAGAFTLLVTGEEDARQLATTLTLMGVV